MKKGSPTKLWPSLMFLLFVALTCFVDVFLAFMDELVRDWEPGSLIIEMGVLAIAMLLPTMCLSVASRHKKAARKDALEGCVEKQQLMHGHQAATTTAAGIRQAGLHCMKRMTTNRQLQDMKKNFPTKLRPSLTLLFFVALTCFVDVLVALTEELLFKAEPHSFMAGTQLIVIALLLPAMCLSFVSWHKTAAQRDAHKDCDDEKTSVCDQQDDATVALAAEHALQNAMDEGGVDVQGAAFAAAVAAVANKYASASSADARAVSQRRAKQLEPVCQAAEEQCGACRRRLQQLQQRQGRQKMQQLWAPLPPQPQPGVCVQEPQPVVQSPYRRSEPRRRSGDQPLYVKASAKPSKPGVGRAPRC